MRDQGLRTRTTDILFTLYMISVEFLCSDVLWLLQPFAFATFTDQPSAVAAMHALNVRTSCLDPVKRAAFFCCLFCIKVKFCPSQELWRIVFILFFTRIVYSYCGLKQCQFHFSIFSEDIQLMASPPRVIFMHWGRIWINCSAVYASYAISNC